MLVPGLPAVWSFAHLALTGDNLDLNWWGFGMVAPVCSKSSLSSSSVMKPMFLHDHSVLGLSSGVSGGKAVIGSGTLRSGSFVGGLFWRVGSATFELTASVASVTVAWSLRPNNDWRLILASFLAFLSFYNATLWWS